jgi:hypothetical protein
MQAVVFRGVGAVEAFRRPPGWLGVAVAAT